MIRLDHRSTSADFVLLLAKGKGVVPGIKRAAEQYGCLDQILDCMTFDVTTHPWRRGGWVDAIITDPPCEYESIRAGTMSFGLLAFTAYDSRNGRWQVEICTGRLLVWGSKGGQRRSPWSTPRLANATDGVRAGAKRAGKKDPRRPMAEAPHVMPNGELSHL